MDADALAAFRLEAGEGGLGREAGTDVEGAEDMAAMATGGGSRRLSVGRGVVVVVVKGVEGANDASGGGGRV